MRLKSQNIYHLANVPRDEKLATCFLGMSKNLEMKSCSFLIRLQRDMRLTGGGLFRDLSILMREKNYNNGKIKSKKKNLKKINKIKFNDSMVNILPSL